jgi:3D-(3,5/4)-trihydroxycyclohexane-1,2-dione acylhydrolase (decyclizing)
MKLTTAQALIRWLDAQWVERDGERHKFFAGCFGIFGHGNVAGIGQALQQYPQFRYYQARNEQAMVHTAAAYAKMKNRLATFACTSSIGPGATNMVTAAAGATINRLPVLLLPGDIFARRNVGPVLQQLESPQSQDVSVNDCFKPISRYWDRINRPDQLLYALPDAMRTLVSQADTGAVTLAMPQDVQTEAFEYPDQFFEDRVWTIARPRPDRGLLARASEWVRQSKRPLIVAGGGVIYGEATDALDEFARSTGIPVVETQAGKGSLHCEHPQALGAMGVTGTPGANYAAREADLVIGIGTRYSDFTTASKTAFQNPDVRFVNVNVAEFDAYKMRALPLVADARVVLEELNEALEDWSVPIGVTERVHDFREDWEAEVDRLYNLDIGTPVAQSAVIGAVNEFADPRDVVVCAAGSLPGDLHKLWRTRDPKSYHLEYGYSCMGYEIAGGLGVKMADPDREVYVMVGDGSYLMMSQEIVTSLQEGYKLTVVLLDNHGFASIGGLSESVGSAGFGTEYRHRTDTGLDGDVVDVDFAANARSLGAKVYEATTLNDLESALEKSREETVTTVIVIETDRDTRVGGHDSWWDVPVAEVSTNDAVAEAREEWEQKRKTERDFV